MISMRGANYWGWKPSRAFSVNLWFSNIAQIKTPAHAYCTHIAPTCIAPTCTPASAQHLYMFSVFWGVCVSVGGECGGSHARACARTHTLTHSLTHSLTHQHSDFSSSHSRVQRATRGDPPQIPRTRGTRLMFIINKLYIDIHNNSKYKFGERDA